MKTTCSRRLTELASGFQDTLAFSNWPEIAYKRIFLRGPGTIVYELDKKWRLACDTRYDDHYAAKEVLGRRTYDELIRQWAQGKQCSYVNIGANVGAFDLAVARLGYEIPCALSIELNPLTFERLNRNLAINSLSQIKTLNVGIADHKGEFPFIPSSHSLSDSLFHPPSAPLNGNEIMVPLITLPDAIKSCGLESTSFHLLKVDCEGAEYGIIRTAPVETLLQFQNILIELHPPPDGENVSALYDRLAKTGFKTEQPTANPERKTELRLWSRSP